MTVGKTMHWEISPGALKASETDPTSHGIMRGFPPPESKRITVNDENALAFPAGRWTYNHWRELYPSKRVWRGASSQKPLADAQMDFSDVRFKITNGDHTTFEEALDLTYTDGFFILHRGRIVYETYRAGARREQPHLAWSVTKSVVGTLAAVLYAEGKIDLNKPVTNYIPELKDSAYGDASVRNVMDMTVAAEFSENYTDLHAEIKDYGYAAGIGERLGPHYRGPRTIASYLPTIRKNGEHGQVFRYITINTEVMTWIISRVAGKSFADLLSDLIWSKIGAEEDAYIHVDSFGMEAGGMGLNTTLRDLARFGEMVRNRGIVDGLRILPARAFDELLRPADSSDRTAFAGSSFAETMPGWTYRDMWWRRNNDNGAFSARGIFGQCLYIDPSAEMVIARYASMPIAGNTANDPISLPLYDAIAARLQTLR